MKKVVWVTALLASLFLAKEAGAHDIRIAVFNIYVSEGKVLCEIKSDRVKTLQAMNTELTADKITAYINQHVQIAFDNKSVPLSFSHHTLTDHFITTTFELNTENLSPDDVMVNTDFLTNEVENHENRVVLQLHQRSRSFRIDSEKNEIRASYYDKVARKTHY